MSCRYAKGDACMILNNNGKYTVFNQDEERCSNQNETVINYIKTIGADEEEAKNNLDCIEIEVDLSMHEEFIMDRFTKRNQCKIFKQYVGMTN